MGNYLDKKKEIESLIKRKEWNILAYRYPTLKYNNIKWFYPETYDWVNYSHTLPEFCYDSFEEWWNPDLFYWDDFTFYHLDSYCGEQFSEWFWN